jgi:hypothetical protein
MRDEIKLWVAPLVTVGAALTTCGTCNALGWPDAVCLGLAAIVAGLVYGGFAWLASRWL